MLPMAGWVEELRKAGADDAAAQSKLPALRVLHFYDMWVKRGPTHQYAVERSMARGSSKMLLSTHNSLTSAMCAWPNTHACCASGKVSIDAQEFSDCSAGRSRVEMRSVTLVDWVD